MPDFDCLSCGACCTHAGDVIVGPEEDVPPHLTRSLRGLVGFGSWEADDGLRRMARRDCGSCKAMTVRKGRHLCRIYARRPEVCRNLEAGSQACRNARMKAGIDND